MLANNTSYIPTIDLFLSHWNSVDLALAPNSFIVPEKKGVIPPGFNRSGLDALRTTLIDNLNTVQDKLNGVQIASGAIKIWKEVIYKRLTRFLELVDGYYVDSEFFSARPETPGITAGEERFLAPMRDMDSLWVRLNAAVAPQGITLPILLQVGTNDAPETASQVQFAALLVTLADKYRAYQDAVQLLTLARARRDKTMQFAKTVMVKYRSSVVHKIAGNQPLIDSLPKVTPEGGHTPDAVGLSMQFTGPDKATGAHTESDDAKFQSYIVVAAVGADSTLEDAVVLATRTNRTPQPLEFTFGLSEPGNAVSYWVIVRTTEGNERASAKVVVVRPDVP